MILEQLRLIDFRVFQGVHELDLAPRTKWNRQRPIILFGGLNGTGKTTILTAVLLVLYGRQALGLGSTQKDYDKFLLNAIHKEKMALVQTNAAAVALTFSFARMGIVSQYEVTRSWIVNNKKVKETLRITQDGNQLKDLNYNQSQAFLNELIPLGVSDLFFFDGEKIKELADDKTGTALTNAIKKLLGLDLIDQLNADLNVVIRNYQKSSSSDDIKQEISKLEADLLVHETIEEKLLAQYENLRIICAERTSEVDRLNAELQSMGGAWIESRNHYEARQLDLISEKLKLEDEIRSQFSALFPLCVAPSFLTKLATTIRTESNLRSMREAQRMVIPKITLLMQDINQQFKESHKEKVNAAVSKAFEDFTTFVPEKLVHDISEGESADILSTIKATKDTARTTDELTRKLANVTSELDEIGIQIARAPDESSLASQFETLEGTRDELAKIKTKLAIVREHRKRNLRESMDITRKLQRHFSALSAVESTDRSCELATGAKHVLKDYVKCAAAAKTKHLEAAFIESFQQLAKKEDILTSARIDPDTFLVSLIDENGNEINKNALSAGEKQIYAISILQALAKTSGRNLPIIIDTPLSRLDSQHRTSLVENYFPNASQQVVILSTDTEVDNGFYQLLSKNISHAYQLVYDPSTGQTSEHEGYFWREKEVA